VKSLEEQIEFQEKEKLDISTHLAEVESKFAESEKCCKVSTDNTADKEQAINKLMTLLKEQKEKLGSCHNKVLTPKNKALFYFSCPEIYFAKIKKSTGLLCRKYVFFFAQGQVKVALVELGIGMVDYHGRARLGKFRIVSLAI